MRNRYHDLVSLIFQQLLNAGSVLSNDSDKGMYIIEFDRDATALISREYHIQPMTGDLVRESIDKYGWVIYREKQVALPPKDHAVNRPISTTWMPVH